MKKSSSQHMPFGRLLSMSNCIKPLMGPQKLRFAGPKNLYKAGIF